MERHGTGDTLELMGTPPRATGTPAVMLGMADEVVGAPSEAEGTLAAAIEMPRQGVGTPSRRRVAAFGATASIARRLAAAQTEIDAVLANADLESALTPWLWQLPLSRRDRRGAGG